MRLKAAIYDVKTLASICSALKFSCKSCIIQLVPPEFGSNSRIAAITKNNNSNNSNNNNAGSNPDAAAAAGSSSSSTLSSSSSTTVWSFFNTEHVFNSKDDPSAFVMASKDREDDPAVKKKRMEMMMAKNNNNSTEENGNNNQEDAAAPAPPAPPAVEEKNAPGSIFILVEDVQLLAFALKQCDKNFDQAYNEKRRELGDYLHLLDQRNLPLSSASNNNNTNNSNSHLQVMNVDNNNDMENDDFDNNNKGNNNNNKGRNSLLNNNNNDTGGIHQTHQRKLQRIREAVRFHKARNEGIFGQDPDPIPREMIDEKSADKFMTFWKEYSPIIQLRENRAHEQFLSFTQQMTSSQTFACNVPIRIITRNEFEITIQKPPIQKCFYDVKRFSMNALAVLTDRLRACRVNRVRIGLEAHLNHHEPRPSTALEKQLRKARKTIVDRFTGSGTISLRATAQGVDFSAQIKIAGGPSVIGSDQLLIYQKCYFGGPNYFPFATTKDIYEARIQHGFGVIHYDNDSYHAWRNPSGIENDGTNNAGIIVTDPTYYGHRTKEELVNERYKSRFGAQYNNKKSSMFGNNNNANIKGGGGGANNNMMMMNEVSAHVDPHSHAVVKANPDSQDHSTVHQNFGELQQRHPYDINNNNTDGINYHQDAAVSSNLMRINNKNRDNNNNNNTSFVGNFKPYMGNDINRKVQCLNDADTNTNDINRHYIFDHRTEEERHWKNWVRQGEEYMIEQRKLERKEQKKRRRGRTSNDDCEQQQQENNNNNSEENNQNNNDFEGFRNPNEIGMSNDNNSNFNDNEDDDEEEERILNQAAVRYFNRKHNSVGDRYSSAQQDDDDDENNNNNGNDDDDDDNTILQSDIIPKDTLISTDSEIGVELKLLNKVISTVKELNPKEVTWRFVPGVGFAFTLKLYESTKLVYYVSGINMNNLEF